MYVKQVIIEGFMTYKDQTPLEYFSPKVNTVVGPNGSGKSNFFKAIRFVLGDLLSTSRPEERRGMLHEGVGQAVPAAYVELVLDNSDGRIPVDGSEVRLRRTISAKKDEYTLDRKSATKTEVVNLLESAGFSRANPYYIVQQGKIRDMAVMKDKERLELLKEVGGTKVYEERRKESLALMKDAAMKKAEIEEMLQFFEDKVNELEGDKDELVKYQQLDRQKRTIEYAIFDGDLQSTKSKLQSIETEREEIMSKSSAVHEQISQAKVERKQTEREMVALEAKTKDIATDKEQLVAKREEVVQKKTSLDLEMEELRSSGQDSSENYANLVSQLSTVKDAIKNAESELSSIELVIQEHSERERELELELMQGQQRLQQLYQKEGRQSQFKTKQGRDKWIKKEMKEIQTTISKKSKTLSNLEAQQQKLLELSNQKKEVVEQQEASMKERELEQEKLVEDLKHLRARKGELQEKRKSLWKTESKLEDQRQNLKSDLQKKERQLDSSVARDIQRGQQSLKRIVHQHKIKGVHGPIIELFECKSTYNTAVEASAGNMLFHVVVDSDSVATEIIRHLNRENGGRVSFIPLNRINVHQVKYPTQYGKDVIPILKVLKYKDIYSKAMTHIFGKTLLCRTIDLASDVSVKANLNCVTLDGDQASHKGALTGGYYEEKRSKIDNMRQVKEMRTKFDDLQSQSRTLKDEIVAVDQTVSQVLGEIQKAEAKFNHSKSTLQSLTRDVKNTKLKMESESSQTIEKTNAINDTKMVILQLEEQHKSLDQELGTDLVSQLTPQDQEEIRKLNQEVKEAKQKQIEVETNRKESEAKRSQLSNNLESNLVKQSGALEQRINSVGDPVAAEKHYKTKLVEEESLKDTLKSIGNQIEKLDRESESIQNKMKDLENTIEKCKGIEESDDQAARDQAGEVEKLMSKKQSLIQKRQELESKIRDLGSLPSDAFGKFNGKSKASLLKLQEKVHKELKKFSHVNKKALDQYMNFTEQRDEYSRRFQEQGKEEQKIEELISALDMQKDELLERTFKGVAREFIKTFSELVPAGSGELVMIRSYVNEEGDQAEKGAVRKYSGVSCKVCFGNEETLKMDQLSGGQKTVVALALIFAIQRCDRAPFYLFDEIDAALDPQYRKNVAGIISQQANDSQNPTQFIQTTFWPELVNISDNIYGVTFKNKVSRIDLIDREDALTFIQRPEEEQENTGSAKRKR